MAQDFWASSGYRLLERRGEGLAATPAWIARFLERAELLPPPDAGPREKALHASLVQSPLAPVDARDLQAVEDADARENWTQFLRFRDRLLAFGTIEACYGDLFRRPAVDLAPAFVDVLVQAIVRGMLEGCADAWLCRAGETLFRRQRLSTEEGRVLCADAATLEVYAATGGFGTVGRLLVQQGAIAEVKMDVLNAENAPLYFMRDELYGFVLDLTPGGEGSRALAEVLRLWVAHMAGVAVAIEPRARVEDERWRWHLGLDVDASALLDALYRGEDVPEADLERLALLFELRFADDRDALAAMAGRPVYLGLACRPDRTLKVKPQNLLLNLPLASRDAPRG
jgi:hypothetical protein